MIRWTIACLGLLAAASAQAEPRRIVSLDYCADQYVMKFAPPEEIVALSPDSRAAFSGLREQASTLPQVRPIAEDVLVLDPTHVVRSYGGGPMASGFFRRAGIDVVEIGFPGGLEEVQATILRVSSELWTPEAGEAVVGDMSERLDRIPATETRQEVLYMTPGGAVPGPGTQVHELLIRAGFANFETLPGWRALPLETLAYRAPAHIAAAFFDDPSQRLFLWSPAQHPVARRKMAETPVTPLKSAWTTCGTWTLVDAVEALAKAREAMP